MSYADGQEAIVPGENIIDSREVIARIEYLESSKEDFMNDNELEEYPGYELCDEDSLWNDWDQDEGEELDLLLKLQDEANGSSDWPYGETLINRDHWVEYCEDLVEELGYLGDAKDLPWWITSNINWQGVADDLEADYFSVNFGDEEYLIRS